MINYFNREREREKYKTIFLNIRKIKKYYKLRAYHLYILIIMYLKNKIQNKIQDILILGGILILRDESNIKE